LSNLFDYGRPMSYGGNIADDQTYCKV